MTARPEVRRRSTVIAGVAAVLLLVAAAVLTVVGASAVVDSTAGEVVTGDTRPTAALPSTDNGAIAVVDADGRLTSVVIVTLLPSGVGGSIVTVPVDADATVGFGDERLPLVDIVDPADPVGFFLSLEAMFSLSFQFGEIVSEDRLAALVEPVAPIEIVPIERTVVEESPIEGSPIEESPNEESLADDAPTDDGTNDTAGDDESVPDGESAPEGAAAPEVDGQEPAVIEPVSLDAREVAAALGTGPAEIEDPHAFDVEIWTALAANAPVAASEPVEVDEFGRPATAESLDEVMARLWRGEVQVRDLLVQSRTTTDAGEPAVILDIRDTLLVFALASPARLNTPNAGAVVRIEAPFSQEQVDASDGRFASSSELIRQLIGELLFVAANPVSVDATPGADGAPAVTRIEVADERLIDDIERLVPNIFGPSEVVVASTLVDGVDVVVKLGTGYIDLKVAQRAGEGVPETDETGGADSTPDGVDGDGGDTVDTDG